ncbi:MAG: tyrosine-type recombinase/integrase [Candidatus Thermoplasmatota archaeon]|nr:tyrosine-type recombinase/integrase [Candidatus Thermoplasmatota archaeon]
MSDIRPKTKGWVASMRKYLKQDELKNLLEAPRRMRDRLIIKLLYETGMRVGELCSLTIGDVDLESGEITIQEAKRHREGRKVPLVNSWTKTMLRDYIGTRKVRKDPLFMSNKRGPLSRRQVERLIWNYGERIGLDKDKRHPHVLRHTHAVHALKSGIDLRTLQQNLGHSSIEVTAIYLTMDIDDRKEEYSKHPLPGMLEVEAASHDDVQGEHAKEEISLPASHTNSFVLSDDV